MDIAMIGLDASRMDIKIFYAVFVKAFLFYIFFSSLGEMLNKTFNWSCDVKKMFTHTRTHTPSRTFTHCKQSWRTRTKFDAWWLKYIFQVEFWRLFCLHIHTYTLTHIQATMGKHIPCWHISGLKSQMIEKWFLVTISIH